MRQLGSPHLHLSSVGSTNDHARRLAEAGAPHGTLVSADHQSSGRGRQGREWVAPRGSSVLISLLLRDPPELLPLIAAVAVAEACGPAAQIKWPNDILLASDGGPAAKVAGILCEARPQENWAVLGVGLNAALDLELLPAELRQKAATLGLRSDERWSLIDRLVAAIEQNLALPADQLLVRWQQRDALFGEEISWTSAELSESGTANGVTASGALLVRRKDGSELELNAGEVHLTAAPS
ncbi:MAG: biotin--[acetyl-CoA-carboxylase] ligase [Solirubrobacterales bacterium]|nr:biotin--[acetyl-CoA-carboxylase] ligase [Solirubrobacterales bacterium]